MRERGSERRARRLSVIPEERATTARAGSTDEGGTDAEKLEEDLEAVEEEERRLQAKLESGRLAEFEVLDEGGEERGGQVSEGWGGRKKYMSA